MPKDANDQKIAKPRTQGNIKRKRIKEKEKVQNICIYMINFVFLTA